MTQQERNEKARKLLAMHAEMETREGRVILKQRDGRVVRSYPVMQAAQAKVYLNKWNRDCHSAACAVLAGVTD